jgi:hypothetical protein
MQGLGAPPQCSLFLGAHTGKLAHQARLLDLLPTTGNAHDTMNDHGYATAERHVRSSLCYAGACMEGGLGRGVALNGAFHVLTMCPVYTALGHG